MQAHQFHKPETVLKRARDLMSLGKKKIALELLHDLLQARRHRTWTKIHEEVMKVFLQLCVDLQNNRMAKEGLHQYRTICQHHAPQSLEVVIQFMLSLSEERAKVAASACDMKVVEEVEDLDNDTTPESILLATVTSEKGKERTEREVLIPWLKFTWETLRTTLEILRNNPKLEPLYHKTAHRAFGFCIAYERKSEFRKLSDILRNHLHNQQKYGKDKSGVLASETMELHLSTRYEQLKAASALRLWQEGFRTIEDIHYIMSISNKRPSSQLMATYYNKLTHLFLISKNFMFHAYAFKAYYLLSRERNKALTEEQAQTMASSVLLAALSIPVQSAKAGSTFVEENLEKDKNRRMAQLLGFDINPKRESLIQDLLNQNILSNVLPEVKELYHIMEEKFTPLTLVADTMPLLTFLKKNEKLEAYAEPLSKLLVIRHVHQLSKVYYSVKLSHFQGLLSELDMPFSEIEKTIIKAVKTRQISLHGFRIDHHAGCMRFGEDVMEEGRSKKLLVDLAQGLSGVYEKIAPVNAAKQEQEKTSLARSVLSTVAARHAEILNRKREIEKRKENFEKHQADKARRMAALKAEETRVQKQADSKKIEDARANMLAKQREILTAKAENLLEKQKLIEKGFSASLVDNMTGAELEQLIKKTEEKAIKDMEEMQRKIQSAARKLDSLMRARREKEQPKYKVIYEENIKKEKELYEKTATENQKKAAEEHEHALKQKAELSPLQAFREEFEAPLVSEWSREYQEMCEKKLKENKIARFREKVKRARNRVMQERKREEQQAAKEEEEARQREEEKRQRIADEENRRAEERRGPPGRGGGSLSSLAAGGGSGAYRPRHMREREGDSREGGGSEGGSWMSRRREEGRGGGSSFPSRSEDSGASWRR